MKRNKLLVILGNLTAFGPFVTDFFLPCLPELTSYFDASASIIQTSLTAGMLGLAAGQLLLGPVSDKYGRKRPLLCCLALFVLATIGCMLSTSIRIFVLFRLLQGLTGAGGLVISKAIVADTFTAQDLTRNLAILAAIQGAAPIVAPVLGGVAFSLSSWQGTFVVLTDWAVILCFMCRDLEESLREEDRLDMPVLQSFRSYIPVLRNGRYLVMNFIQGFASAALMAYISASPFIFQNHFGLSPMMYSICFACNAAGLVIGSAVVMKISNLAKATTAGVTGLVAMCICASAALLAALPFAIFEIFLFLMLFCVGMITPVAMTRALNVINGNRGVASAMLGAVPFLLGGIVAPMTGIGNMLHSTVIIIVGCSLVCLLLYLVSLKWKY